jgi:hypothetical protein
LACERRVVRDELLPGERQLLLEAKGWLALERRRREAFERIGAAVPRGAEVVVDAVEGELAATVALDAASMQPDAADGWQLQEGGVLEFAGGVRPWSEIETQQLRSATGIDSSARSARIEFDVAFPPASVGRRAYVFEYRGIAVLLALTGGDGVHAAVVDGEARRPEVVQRAFERAIHEALGPARAVAVPRGVHRIGLAIQVSRSQPRANVVVTIDGVELAQANVPFDGRAATAVAVLPLQEMWVHRVTVRALMR